MRNILFVLILSILIMACNGGNHEPFHSTISKQLNQYKGRINKPEVTEVEVVNGDSLYLNQRLIGETYGYDTTRLYYIPEETGHVFVQFSGVKTMYFEVINEDDEDRYSSILIDNGHAAFHVEKGQVYSFNMYYISLEYDSDMDSHIPVWKQEYENIVNGFEFEITEANREAIGLSEDEFLVDIEYVGESYSDGFVGSSIERTEWYFRSSIVLNFLNGYRRHPSYNSTPEYAIAVSSELMFIEHIEYEGIDYGESKDNIIIDSNSGLVTGTYFNKSNVYQYPENTLHEVWFSEGSIEGKIIL